LWSALNTVLTKQKRQPHEVAVIFDIGCSGNGSNWIRAYTFHGLHGRALPLAVGVNLANHGLKTIVISGDGAAYGEGVSHFLAAIRANPNITYIVEDNQLYALTKGQTSPTTSRGAKTDSAPFGVTDEPFNPIAVAVAMGASFVARGFAGDLPHLETLLDAAIQHPGFALVDIFQPCVTFNKLNTFTWFYDHVRKLETLQHDPTNQAKAMKQAWEMNRYLPIGLFYRQIKPTLSEQQAVLKTGPLVNRSLKNIDISHLLKSLA